MLTGVQPVNPALDAEDAIAEIEIIPTVFGRLVYLATTWDPSVKGYRCNPWAGMANPEGVNAALGRTHQKVFLQWLGLSLDRQRRDLMRFADSDGPGAYECIWSWWSNGFFDHLAPATAEWHETQLFKHDLVLVIKSLVGDPKE
jgi:hypothetical protein